MPTDETQQPSNERRRYLRLGFDCPVRWSDGMVDRFGMSRDVSEAGAGFTVRGMSAPRIGQNIRLVFELDPEREWVVDEHAKVTRCEPREADLYEVGVELTPCW